MRKWQKRAQASLVAGVAISFAALFAAGVLTPKVVKGDDHSDSIATVQALSDSFASIAERVSPAVVFIHVEKEMKGNPVGFFDQESDNQGQDVDPREFFRHFFGPGMGGPGGQRGGGSLHMQGEGSGFIISPDGYIVTNNHVAGDTDAMQVKLADGRTFDAKLVGTDPDTEIALIKIDAKNLPTVTFGDSDRSRVGEWVLAFGSPFGLKHSVTQGIISARGRGDVGIVDYADFIQTDAAINPGNSGGPLVNMKGEVIGMNTAIMSRAGGSDGVGFSIPVNMVKFIVDQLRDHGTITRGYIGVGLQEVTPQLAKWFGLTDGTGVLVAEVAPRSPAEKAGLKRDDVILSYNGQPIGEVGAFRSHISTTPSGSDATLEVLRNGEHLTKHVTIANKPGEPQITAKQEPSKVAEASPGKLGVYLQALTPEIAKQLEYTGSSGVVVAEVQPGSPAADAGIEPGAIIVEVNKQPINDPRDVAQALKKNGKGNTTLLLVRDKGAEGSRYVAIDTSA